MELEENLQIVFDKEEIDRKKGDSCFYYKRTMSREISYPNAELLIEMFSTLTNDTVKAYFIEYLRKGVSDSNETPHVLDHVLVFISRSALCFYTLVQLDYTNDAINALNKRSGTCCILSHLLSMMLENDFFDSKQLTEILKIINAKPFSQNKDGLKSNIIQARFDMLKKQIRKTNVEINQDKKTVTEKIFILGLSPKYNELLSSIDSFILTDTSKIVNSGMISNLRAFMADLLKDVATRIAQKEHVEIPKIEKRSEMGNIRCFLKGKLELSDADDKFIDSFIDILHHEGGHAFMSDKEYFRLSRNIAIEIAYFMLSKYEKKYKN